MLLHPEHGTHYRYIPVFVCSDILREPTHRKTTRAFFEQPSVVLQLIGDAGQVDQGGHDSVQ